MATNLLGIRTRFIQSSMRYDLITGGDFTADNGADIFINDAQEFLDRRVIGPHQERRYTKLLSIGDYFFTIDKLISITSVVVKDTQDLDNELADITGNGLSYKSFRIEHNGAISGWSAGQPTSWAPAPLLFSPEFTQVEVLTEVDFVTVNNWTLLGGWTNTDEQLVASAETATVTQVFADQTTGSELVVGRTYRITFTITEYTSGDICAHAGIGGIGTPRSAAGIYTEDLVCITNTDFILKPGTAFTGKIDNVSCVDITLQDAFINTVPLDIGDTLPDLAAGTNASLTGIVFNPPADSAYTMEVSGRFYTRALSADTDTSYWTVNYPSMLTSAAVYLAEEAFGSADRARQLLANLEVKEEGVHKEYVAMEMSGWDLEPDV